MKRRSFLKTSSFAVVGAGSITPARDVMLSTDQQVGPTLSLNAYSFNRPLLAGEMNLEELFRFAQNTGFPAVDLTAYYIPGYPDVPDDQVLFGIKKSAFRLGIAISGTGVRNDFTLQDPAEHAANIDLVKRWIVAASKLGAPHVRVFYGNGTPEGSTGETVMDQAIDAFQECSEFGAQHGVMVAFQNHNDAIKSTGAIMEILSRVTSDWFGLMLDTGSVRGSDTYRDIARLIPYAITWQVKENLFSGDETVPTDFNRLMKIVYDAGFRGYFPLETLGEGDPFAKVSRLYQQVVQEMV